VTVTGLTWGTILFVIPRLIIVHMVYHNQCTKFNDSSFSHSCRLTCVLSETIRTYNSAPSRPPLAANARADMVPHLCLNIPLSQRTAPSYLTEVHLAGNWRRGPQSYSFISNINSNCSARPTFYVGWPSILSPLLVRGTVCLQLYVLQYLSSPSVMNSTFPVSSSFFMHWQVSRKVPLQCFCDSVTIIMYILNNNKQVLLWSMHGTSDVKNMQEQTGCHWL